MTTAANILVGIKPAMQGMASTFGTAGKLAGAAAAAGFGEEFARQVGRAMGQTAKAAGDAFQGTGGKLASDFMSDFNSVMSGQKLDLSAITQPFETLENAITAPIMNTIGKIPLLGDAMRDVKGYFDTATAGGTDFMQTMINVGDTYLEMSRKIAGATIDTSQIEGLTQSVRDIMASGVPVHINDVTEAIGRLNTNISNLSSEQLKELTTNFALAEELVGRIDPTAFAGVVNAWDLGAEGANKALLEIANTARDTGIDVNTMMNEMTQTGSSMRLFGYNMQQVAAYFAEMKREGEPATLAVRQWSHAIAEAVKAGHGDDPKAWFEQQIQAAKDFAKSNDMQDAMEVIEKLFGQRPTPSFMEALRKGVVDVPELMAGLQGVDQQVKGAVEETLGLGQAFEKIGQQAQSALEPVGRYLAKGLVEGGTQISEWLKDNQDKIIGWTTAISQALIKFAGDFTRFVGDSFVALSAFVNPIKDFVIVSIQAMIAPLKLFLDTMVSLPFIGDKFKGAEDSINDINNALTKMNQIDMGHGAYQMGHELQHVGKDILPDVASKVGDIGTQMQGVLDISKAFTENINGELQPAVQQMRDSAGKLVQGTAESPFNLQLLGTPDQMRDAANKLRDMGVDIQTNTQGVITAIRFESQKAHEDWVKWYEEQNKKPGEIGVTVKPKDKDGKDISGPADLVPPGGPGSVSVGVTPDTSGTGSAVGPGKGVVVGPGGTLLPEYGTPSGGPALSVPPAGMVPSGPSGGAGPGTGATTSSSTQAIQQGIIMAGRARGLPDAAIQVALAVASAESGFNPTISGGIQGSAGLVSGLYQQSPSSGWGTLAQVNDPNYAINAFYNVFTKNLAAHPDSPLLAGVLTQNPQLGSGAQGSAYWNAVQAKMGQAGGILGGAVAGPSGTPSNPVNVVPAPGTTPSPGTFTVPGFAPHLTGPGGTPAAPGPAGEGGPGKGKIWVPANSADPNSGGWVDIDSPAGKRQKQWEDGIAAAQRGGPASPEGVKAPRFNVPSPYDVMSQIAGMGVPSGPASPLQRMLAGKGGAGGPADLGQALSVVGGAPVGISPIAPGTAGRQPKDLGEALGVIAGAPSGEGMSPEQKRLARLLLPGQQLGGGVPLLPGTQHGQDGVLINAAPGEHMWTHPEVQAAGGHGNVMKLRAAALAGKIPSYQPGGPIGGGQNVAPLNTEHAQVDTIAIGYAIEQAFGITDQGFYRSNDQGSNEHTSGEAVDIMVGGADNPVGYQVKDFALANADAYGVQYAIWQNKLWYPGGNVEAFGADWNDVTNAHRNHVHIRTSGGGFPQGQGPGAAAGTPRTGPTSDKPAPAAAQMVSSGTLPLSTFQGGPSYAGGMGSGGGMTGGVGPGGPSMPGYASPWGPGYADLTPAKRSEWITSTEEWQRSQLKAGQELTDATNNEAVTRQQAADAQKKVDELRAKITTPAEAAAKQAELEKDLADLSAKNKAWGDAQQKLTDATTNATIEMGKHPPEPPGYKEGVKPDQNAEALGKGLVSGIFQGLGFPDVFGKPPSEWGISKLLMGGLGWGLSTLQNPNLGTGTWFQQGGPLAGLGQPGVAQEPGGAPGAPGGGGGGGLLGLLQGMTGFKPQFKQMGKEMGGDGLGAGLSDVGPQAAHSTAPVNLNPAATPSGYGGPGLTVNQYNSGVMAPPEIKQTVQEHAFSSGATQAGFGAGAPVIAT